MEANEAQFFKVWELSRKRFLVLSLLPHKPHVLKKRVKKYEKQLQKIETKNREQG